MRSAIQIVLAVVALNGAAAFSVAPEGGRRAFMSAAVGAAVGVALATPAFADETDKPLTSEVRYVTVDRYEYSFAH